jgi:iron complex outermembrane recepter protein
MFDPDIGKRSYLSSRGRGASSPITSEKQMLSIRQKTIRKNSLPIAIAIAATIFSAPSVWAAEAAEAPAASGETDALHEVIVTGTRQTGIIAAESAAPIQIVAGDALQATGKSTLIDALAQLVPSFQAQAFGSDMANQTQQARIRGLSPNDVLVLVDGKRRHTTASLAIDGGSAYSGGAGVDLNFIPMAAVDHIEVLTEGAAAQYGSDAIAGVINIILKKNNSGGTIDTTYGRFFDGGGNTTKVEANAGFAPTENSFLNVTAQIANHGHTDRGNVDPRTDPTYWNLPACTALDSCGNPNSNIPLVPGYPNINYIQGDAETHFKLFAFNAGVTLPGDIELYSNGTYGNKDSQSFENYRVPGKVVYDPTTAAATAAADGLTPPPAGTVITTYPFPLGFNPLEESKENDFQLVAGVKGSSFGFNWDLAEAYGEDNMKVYTIDSANATLYADTGATPTNFYDGKFISTQSTTTLDITKDLDLGLAGPLTVAFGAEHRRETWVLGPGDASSYIGGGAQSFPGYSPVIATNAARHSDAGYIDFAATPITGLKLDAAGRYEAYSDFGDATVGKFTARYDFNPAIAVRGTVSSGFRAPTLAEEHYTNVNVGPTTAFVQLAPDGPGTGLLGLGGGLKPERSTNLSFGVVFRPLESLTATIDAYQIVVTNRIVASGNINGQSNGVPYPGSANVTAAIAASGLSIDPGVIATGTTGINLFANGVDTRTRGVDFTLISPQDYAFGHVDWSVAGSYNYTVATSVLSGTPEMGGQPLFDAQAITALTSQSPRVTLNLGAHYTVSQYYVDLHEIIYGKSSSCDNPDSDTSKTPYGTPCASYGVTATSGLYYYQDHIGTIGITNLELGANLTDKLTLAIGANNLFNRYPNQINPANTAVEAANFDNAAVEKYPPFSPFGLDGGFYYARVHYKF